MSVTPFDTNILNDSLETFIPNYAIEVENATSSDTTIPNDSMDTTLNNRQPSGSETEKAETVTMPEATLMNKPTTIASDTTAIGQVFSKRIEITPQMNFRKFEEQIA